MATPADLRPSAVAGTFYPAAPAALAAEVGRHLGPALADRPADAPLPKALIAPHAGYVYSGAIAASAYARIAPLKGRVSRVVLLGPAHRLAFRGLAVPSVGAFETPLGPVPLDRAAIDAIRALPDVVELDQAHALEHSLEVHLPFLVQALGSFSLVPIVVGEAAPASVAAVLDRLWGGPETLIVVSSDLSHYHDYATATARDRRTGASIETLALERIEPRDACGARPLAGLLAQARALDLRVTTLDLRNSGDTAGGRDRVVGYGAWSVTEGDQSRLTETGRRMLLTVAARSIRNGLNTGRRPEVRLGTFGRELECQRGAFVTLSLDGRLRGCIGSPLPRQALVADVAWNAYSAAFEDPRFARLSAAEFPRLELSVSVMGAPSRLAFASEAELLAQIRPELDGLILAAAGRRGLFLPQVWQQLPAPVDFLRRLKAKAGLPADFWSDDLAVERFSTESFAADIASLELPAATH